VAFSPLRRRVVCAGVAAGSLFLPVPYAKVWAQSGATLKLLRVPKLALAVGNNKYRDAPLKNPVNDARAIGEALQEMGFEVTVKLEAGRAELAAAVRAYTQALASRKCVGLFYYAGHAIQLAWRNYMLPVDAEINTIADIQKQAVEVGELLEGMKRAANPMNVIILDACRDNPFVSLKGVDHKGLAQMDAPLSTLLAYATSPGNIASDGDGANGLYTEHLLKEIKVPQAKIEDVFKRVRLGVRRRSNGQQVPWESTSLEEDFYFLPPQELRKITEPEAEKQFNQELAIWEKIKKAQEPAPLEEYLRQYPSGHFAELAQFQLDRVLARLGEKKIQVESLESNPYSKGTAVADTKRKVGDSYTYREFDLYTKIVNRTFTRTITEITDNEVIYAGGGRTDLLGNSLRTSYGAPSTGSQIWGVDYAVGKRWTSRHKTVSRNGVPVQVDLEVRVVAREKITVPAGTFDAFVVEANGYAIGAGVNTRSDSKRWIAPHQVRAELAIELHERGRDGRVVASERRELVSFRQT